MILVSLTTEGGAFLGELKLVPDGDTWATSINYNVMYRPRPHGNWSRTSRIVGWSSDAPAWSLVARAIEVLELDDVAARS